MSASKKIRRRPSDSANIADSLLTLDDAVHGTIDLSNYPNSDRFGVDLIPKLLGTPIIQRLRRIEQLGFASQRYIAADHSRYAHALGTMHVMRRMLSRLLEHGRPPLHSLGLRLLGKTFGIEECNGALIGQHFLIAALLQDIGELPYNFASTHAFKPHAEVYNIVSLSLQRRVEELRTWPTKHVFAVASLFDKNSGISPLLDLLNKHLLAFLITGVSPSSSTADLTAFRHMFDGVVDADRLDYVFRDAHHTVGTLGSPDAVIDTLSCYTARGPVFLDAGPVSRFLATRAHLYATVYLAPANRFRMIALLTALKRLQDRAAHTDEVKSLFSADCPFEPTLMDFIKLDDVHLSAWLLYVGSSRNCRNSVGPRGCCALDLFNEGIKDYKAHWLPRVAPNNRPRKLYPLHEDQETSLPPGVFWDPMEDLGGPIYDQNSVHVVSGLYDFIGGRNDVPLEECGGPFDVTTKKEALLPKKGRILLFLPQKNDGQMAVSKSLQGVLDSLRASPSEFSPDYIDLYWSLLEHSPTRATILNPPPSTVEKKWPGDVIFLSHRTMEEAAVRQVQAALYAKRRRYHSLSNEHQGIQLPVETFQRSEIMRCRIALLLISREFCSELTNTTGPLMKEVLDIARLGASGELCPYFLPLDDPDEMGNCSTLWTIFKHENPPWLSRHGVRTCGERWLSEFLDATVKLHEASGGQT